MTILLPPVRNFLLLGLATLLFCNCKGPAALPNDTIESIQSFDDLSERWQASADTVHVINFWATTCPPCLKEMPHFAQLEKTYTDVPIKVLLVSTDEAADLQTRVKPFVEKHQITPEVVLLADDNYSAWTGKVDPSWYGALPATLITKGAKRTFRFGKYDSYEELVTDVDKVR